MTLIYKSMPFIYSIIRLESKNCIHCRMDFLSTNKNIVELLSEQAKLMSISSNSSNCFLSFSFFF